MIRGASFLFSFFERYDRSTLDGLGAFYIPVRGRRLFLHLFFFPADGQADGTSFAVVVNIDVAREEAGGYVSTVKS